jgi:hypothetical protein
MKYVRWALTLALLAVVSQHAHWSVTLCLALTALSCEAQAMLWRTVSTTLNRGGVK